MNIKDAQQLVREFHEKFGCTIGRFPAIRDEQLRLSLIKEEVNRELIPAIIEDDMVQVADGLADAIYVLLGTAVAFGIDIEPVFREVHRSNMSKTPGNVRADGKILKGESFSPPDIAGELRKQGWRP